MSDQDVRRLSNEISSEAGDPLGLGVAPGLAEALRVGEATGLGVANVGFPSTGVVAELSSPVKSDASVTWRARASSETTSAAAGLPSILTSTR